MHHTDKKIAHVARKLHVDIPISIDHEPPLGSPHQVRESKTFMANPHGVKRLLLAMGLSLWLSAAYAAGPDLDKADALMREGKAAEAYSLLEPFEFEQSGNVRYDYLLGIAALDSGKPDKATLAFERVLATDPNFAGARIDMGRAYFQLGDITRAKTEFETVLTQNPPPTAKATIDRYLAEIAKLESAKQTRTSGYIEATAGHDSNVNFATSQAQIAVPALGNLIFTLNPTAVKAPDDYFGIGFGGEVSHQYSSKLGVYAGADVRNRNNSAQNQFDSTSIDGRAGIALGEGSDIFRFGVLAGKFDLGHKSNRDTNGVNAEWRHLLNQTNQLSIFGQYVRFRFEPTISVNNFDQSTYGINWLSVLNEGKALFSASAYTGDERAPLRADGGKKFSGVRLGGQLRLNDKTELFAGIGALYGRYEIDNAAFSTPTDPLRRNDKQYDASLGLAWHYSKLWTVQPQIAYLRNNSNIVINQHDRTDVSITLRREFK